MNNITRNIDTFRLTRFDVVFIAENVNGELVECHFITNALNQYDAAYVFGQNNPQQKYVIKEVNEVIQPF